MAVTGTTIQDGPMIFCGMTIAYLTQLERAGRAEASALAAGLRNAAAELGGRAGSREHPILAAFPDGGPFSLLMAADAIRRFKAAFDTDPRAFRGASIVVHRCDDADAALPVIQALRLTSFERYALLFSREAREALAPYFAFPATGDTDPWMEPRHASALRGADPSRIIDRPGLANAVRRAVDGSAARLLRIDTGPGSRSPASLAAALASPDRPVLVLYGDRIRPFSPFSCPEAGLLANLARSASGQPGPGDPESAALDALEPAWRAYTSSPYDDRLPDSVRKGCVAYLDLVLDRAGSRGAVIVCDRPGCFSPEAADLVGRRLSTGRGSERYVALCDEDLPDAWKGPWASAVRIQSADERERSTMVQEALGSCRGETRLRLGTRFEILASGGLGRRDDAGRVIGALRALPREAAIYLYGLLLGEGALSADETAQFFSSMGLPPPGADLLAGLLRGSGLVDPADPGRPLRPVDAAAAADVIGPAEAAAMDARYAAFLVSRYHTGTVRPSLGFLERVGERDGEERLLFDCVFDEALRAGVPRAPRTIAGTRGSLREAAMRSLTGSRATASADIVGMVDVVGRGARDPGGEAPDGPPSFLSPTAACAYRFWSAMSTRDRAQAEAAVAESGERVTGPRAPAVRALMQAELAYAVGDAVRAARGARDALLTMGRGAPPRLESRSHRMMGLAALATERYAEATDYLANAQELAEAARDDHERMMAAYARAIAEFMSGALGRAERAADLAAESAGRLFRVDAKAALESLRGRIDLELGSYDRAVERYRALAALGAEYSMPAVTARAEVWKARALAYAGAFSEAAAILESRPLDPEARVFRGELELLRDRPEAAARWLDQTSDAGARPFRPADAFDWDSPYAEIEGRCLGFDRADSALADLRTALALYARGLADRDPSCAVGLHELTREPRFAKANPGMGTYSLFCYLLEERLSEPPVDKQTVLSRAFKALQQRAGRMEDRAQRALYMEKNVWNARLLEAARLHKFI